MVAVAVAVMVMDEVMVKYLSQWGYTATERVRREPGYTTVLVLL